MICDAHLLELGKTPEEEFNPVLLRKIKDEKEHHYIAFEIEDDLDDRGKKGSREVIVSILPGENFSQEGPLAPEKTLTYKFKVN